jgi:hypothetical protein
MHILSSAYFHLYVRTYVHTYTHTHTHTHITRLYIIFNVRLSTSPIHTFQFTHSKNKHASTHSLNKLYFQQGWLFIMQINPYPLRNSSLWFYKPAIHSVWSSSLGIIHHVRMGICNKPKSSWSTNRIQLCVDNDNILLQQILHRTNLTYFKNKFHTSKFTNISCQALSTSHVHQWKMNEWLNEQ